MNVIMLIVTIALIVIIAPSKSHSQGTPQTQLSESDLDKALNDRRYLTRQLKCTLGEAPCDPVGKRLKSLAPLVLRGPCPQCNPQEVRQIQKVLVHVQTNYPKEWSKILQKYSSG